jgi:hypothetical protein
MKINSVTSERGSVLVTALITITILTMICATSLYVASQNTNAGMQTASWQQALSGAESAVDQAFNALNLSAAGTSGAWTNWKKVNNSLPYPPTKPSGGSSVSVNANPPTNGNYYYLIPSDIIFQSGVEGNNSVSSWVTIDTAGTGLAQSGTQQWYRVRATGRAGAPGPKRVSNQRLDNDLRKLSLIFDRTAGGAISSPVASRTIEVIAMAPQKLLAYGILMRNSINLQGSVNLGIDSFDSTDPNKSTNGQYDSTKAQSHGNVATVNSTGSNLNNKSVDGSLAYSGPTIPGIGGVTGTISTPFNASVADTSDPAGSPSSTYSGVPPGMSLSASGTKINPTLVKINGDFTLNSGAFSVVNGSNNGGAVYITIWVTGQFQMSGGSSGSITQGPNVYVTWVVDGNITAAGGTATNQNGTAPYTTFIGVGTGGTAVSIGGNSNFIAALNAPGYDITIGGTGSLIGSVTGNSLTMIGNSSIHYDEALSASANSTIGTYVVASWFEDNSGPANRGQTF